ncbi:MAG: winged helix-turn-helix transcriptional regulator [Gemmatimonadota bacterium]
MANRCAADYACPVELTLDVLGGKWKILILWHLEGGALRFGELNRRIEGVSERMLTRQLRELALDGLVERRAYAEVPPRVEYSLTERGRSVEPLIAAICDWGSSQMERLAS